MYLYTIRICYEGTLVPSVGVVCLAKLALKNYFYRFILVVYIKNKGISVIFYLRVTQNQSKAKQQSNNGRSVTTSFTSYFVVNISKSSRHDM